MKSFKIHLSKKIHYLILGILLTACQDVVDVDLPPTESHFIVDAILKVYPQNESVDINIKLSQNNSFFDEINPINNADEIYILWGEETDNKLINPHRTNLVYDNSGNGNYIQDPNSPLNHLKYEDFKSEYVYWLVIYYNHKTYAAKTSYFTGAPIDHLEIGEGSLANDEDTELKITFTDDPSIENYYLFDLMFNNYITTEDTFYSEGPFSFSYFYDEKINKQDILIISLLGIDKDFYDYMNVLLELSGNSFNPFDTPASNAIGNLVDVTGIPDFINSQEVNPNPENPLGYFIASQVYVSYIEIE